MKIYASASFGNKSAMAINNYNFGYNHIPGTPCTLYITLYKGRSIKLFCILFTRKTT